MPHSFPHLIPLSVKYRPSRVLSPPRILTSSPLTVMAIMMTFTLTHRSQKHTLTLPSSALVSSLRQEIHYLTSVPPSNQKLLPKPAKGVLLTPAATTDATTIEDAGLKDGMSIMVLGATAEEVGKVKREETEASKWKQPRNYHPSMLQGTKVSLPWNQ